jgi:uncharacterized protein (TIGR03435 family)
MKYKLLAAFVLLCGASATLFGQDLAGTWQGTLTPQGGRGGAALRVVFKITSAPDGKFTGQAFSIDQGAGAIPMNTIAVESRTVKWKVDAINASYEGTFSPDGNAINGTLTQGAPVPLNLNRATPQTAWAIPEPPPAPKPMDPAADPDIEVATVKPSPPGGQGRLYTVRGLQVMAINVTLLNVITFAYDLHERQVSGGPAWMSTDRFEISIKPDTPGQPNNAQMKKLFQKALADRFQLKFHTEKRELSVYAITLPANTKHKLTESTAGGNLPSLLFPRIAFLPARNATMMDLAQSMQGAVMDRPVVNQTGIAGRYDFTLDWMPDDFQFASFGPRPPMPDNGKPNIFQAFQDQLGLKLESTRAPADVLVIDKAEKPSDN